MQEVSVAAGDIQTKISVPPQLNKNIIEIPPPFSTCVCVCVCAYIYIYMCVCVCVCYLCYIYSYIRNIFISFIFQSVIQHVIWYISFLYSKFAAERSRATSSTEQNIFPEADSGWTINKIPPPSYCTRIFILVFTRHPIPGKSLQITILYPLWAI